MIRQLQAELKASLRLRVGLALIVAVLWLNGVLSLRDQVAEEAKRQGQLAAQITRARAYSNQTEWPERAKQAQMALVELEGRLWRSETEGLAQAAFQDWLKQSLNRAGVTHSEVAPMESASAAKNGDDLWKIKTKLSFDFSPPALGAWMAELAGQERQVAIEKLHVRLEPMPRMETIFVAPFQKASK